MTTPTYWQQATDELSARDPIMAKLIAFAPDESLVSKGDAYFTLARAISGQQISVKAAETIWGRLEQGIGNVQPETILRTSEEELRSYGFSRQKIKYLKAIAEWFAEHGHTTIGWHETEDEDVVRTLIALPGIGHWTAEMFLIFHLLKPDIFPLADIGLIKAVERYYNNSEKLSKDKLLEISDNWKPWRTVATWYLWRSLDPVAVGY